MFTNVVLSVDAQDASQTDGAHANSPLTAGPGRPGERQVADSPGRPRQLVPDPPLLPDLPVRERPDGCPGLAGQTLIPVAGAGASVSAPTTNQRIGAHFGSVAEESCAASTGNGLVDQNANELWSVLVCRPYAMVTSSQILNGHQAATAARAGTVSVKYTSTRTWCRMAPFAEKERGKWYVDEISGCAGLSAPMTRWPTTVLAAVLVQQLRALDIERSARRPCLAARQTGGQRQLPGPLAPPHCPPSADARPCRGAREQGPDGPACLLLHIGHYGVATGT